MSHSTAALFTARLRSRLGLGALIALAVAAGVALVCGLSAASAVVSSGAVRDAVPAADQPGGWVLVTTGRGSDAAAQDAAASAVFTRLFGDTMTVSDALAESDRDRAWRLAPARQALDIETAPLVSAGLSALPEAFRSSDAAVAGSIVTGTLPEVMDDVAAGARSARAIAPVPVALAAVLAWFAVLQLARLLGSSRGREAALLRTRGLSPAQLTALAVGESAIIAVAGGGVGFAAVVAAGLLVPGGVSAVLATWPFAVAATILSWATLAIGQARAARDAGRAAALAGRVARAASPAAAALLVIIGGVVVWLVASGSATEDAWSALLTTAAPTLGIAAAAVLAVLVFGPLSAVVAHLAGNGRRLAPAYPARQVARRQVAYSVAVALVVIAVAGAVLAGSYGATWTAAATASQSLVAGAPLRAAVQTVTPGDLRPVPGVTAAAPVVSAPVIAGEVSGTFLALPAGRIAEVVLPVDGLVDPVSLGADLAAISDDAPGVELPSTAVGIAVHAKMTSIDEYAARATTIQAWLADASGTPTAVPLRVDASAPPGITPDYETLIGFALTGTADLPAGTAPWRLLGIEVARGQAYAYLDARISSVTAATTGADGAETPIPITPATSVSLPAGTGKSGVSSALVWSAAGERAEPLPAIVTRDLATRLALDEGSTVDLRVDGSGRTYPIEVAGIVAALPGVGTGVGALVDLDTLTARSLPTRIVPGEPAATPPLANEIWATGSRAALEDALGVTVTTPRTAASGVAASISGVWGVASVGAAVLSGVALLALFAALTAARAGEVMVLRAVGVGPAAQARLRTVEVGVVAVLSLLLGLVAGLALSALLIPALATRSIPGLVVTPRLGVDPVPVLLTSAILAGAVVVAAAITARVVRAQGASTAIEEAAP